LKCVFQSGIILVKGRSKELKRVLSIHRRRSSKLFGLAVLVTILFSVSVISYFLIIHFTGSRSVIEENFDDGSGHVVIKAALIDPLSVLHPNMEFTEAVNRTLREAGFEVDIFQGDVVTVDFLKRFDGGYQLVVLRMHSALSSRNELYLFTAEAYSTDKYVEEQHHRLVKEAYATEGGQSVFAVNWGFIKRLMTDKFENSLVLAMGCDSIVDGVMVQEFMNQGAVGYVGWNGPVLLSHSDQAFIHLIHVLYVEDLDLEEAVKKANSEVGADAHWRTLLECLAG